ncbi:MAG: geranylgeranylglycerol-phosphate geranylgeranyltransferase [Flavisolibacter sp.]
MNLVSAFLRLIRWPNLLFIILTQLLFYYCIYVPLYGLNDYIKLTWLMIASVFIAAAGYIINDYFDLNIDQVNKPEKNVFVRTINRRWAIIWHLIFNLMGILATVAAVGLHKWYLIVANLFCILLLWFYSTSFKRQVIIGNLIISVLTAWTVLVLFFGYTEPHEAFMANPVSIKFFRLAFLYGGFAFVISLIREAVKDMEDLEGDARYGCRTLPIVSGIRATKLYATIWIVVLVAALLVLQLYILQFGWWPAVIYSTIFVILPLLYMASTLTRAHNRQQFGAVSRLTKWIMLTGILSMIFFRIYF